VENSITFVDADIAPNVEWLDARSDALEDVRPSVEGVSHFL
jgi:hypothetical protein